MFDEPPDFPKIEIRQCTQADAKFMGENSFRYTQEMKGTEIDTERCEKLAIKSFEFPDHTSSYVVEVNGVPAGSMGMTIEFNALKNACYTWLQNVFILKEFRGFKLFSKMFKFAVEKAKNLGHQGFKLYVEKATKTARQIYLHYGLKFPKVEIIEIDFASNQSNGIFSPEADEEKLK